MHPEISTLTDAAMAHARRGWAVIPLHDVTSGSCSCRNRCGDSAGKHPINRGWTTGPALSSADIASIWMPDAGGTNPTANIGIRTGAISGIFVLDVDPKNGGFDALKAMIAANGPLPSTYEVKTGSGGAHLYFALPVFEIRNGANKEMVRHYGPGLDIRGDGGQVVAAPSVSGVGPYEIVNDVDPAPAPRWLLDLMQVSIDTTPIGEATVIEDLPTWTELTDRDQARVGRYADSVVQAEVARYASAAPGTGDDTLFRVCCNLWEIMRSPWNLVTAEQVFSALNQARAQRQAVHPTGGGQTPEDLLRVWKSAETTTVGRGRPLPVDPSLEGVVFDAPFSIGGVAMTPPDDPRLDRPTEGEPARLDDADLLMSLLLNRDALDNVPPVKPLIEDVLDLASESWIIGAPGGFKSFVALDMAAHVAMGIPWQGKKVHQGKVLYVAAEGTKGIPRRVKAWEAQNSRRMENVLVLPRPVQVKDADTDRTGAPGRQWRALVEMTRRLGFVMIVVDTQARVTVGMNENDNSEMGVLIEAVRQLKEASGACVLIVHHTGRNGQDARGASAIDGAQDTEIRVDRPNGNERSQLTCTVSLDKQKDGDDTLEFALQMVVHEVGVTENGKVVTSLAPTGLNPFGQPARRQPWIEDLPTNQMHIVKVMDIICDADGQTVPNIRKALKEHGHEVSDSSFYKAFNVLKERRVIASGASAQRWTLSSKLE